MSHHSRLLEAQQRSVTARANAMCCAEKANNETDQAVKTYLRLMAVSWTQIAEDHEFLLEMDRRQKAQAGGSGHRESGQRS